jgi:hypothetical protein
MEVFGFAAPSRTGMTSFKTKEKAILYSQMMAAFNSHRR